MPFDNDVVKGAPDVADSSHLDAGEQQGLYSYYERYLRGGGDAAYGRGGTDTANVRGAGHDTSSRNTDDAMTRSPREPLTLLGGCQLRRRAMVIQ